MQFTHAKNIYQFIFSFRFSFSFEMDSFTFFNFISNFIFILYIFFLLIKNIVYLFFYIVWEINAIFKFNKNRARRKKKFKIWIKHTHTKNVKHSNLKWFHQCWNRFSNYLSRLCLILSKKNYSDDIKLKKKMLSKIGKN